MASYTIPSTDIIVKRGDCVLMRPAEPESPLYVARVKNIEVDQNNTMVRIQWYYRPEDSEGGRRSFHGEKELFLSDHYDLQNASTIIGKCTVHSLKSYTELENAGTEDYFCRFQYKAATTKKLTPSRVPVFCRCAMPQNPDDTMVQCDRCLDWFHPSCVGMTSEDVKDLVEYFCSTECIPFHMNMNDD